MKEREVLMNENTRLEFRFGLFGKLIPLLVAIGFIIYAAVNGSNVNGYVVAFFMAIILGVIVAKDEKAYGQAIISGLTKPMFPVIALAVILAAISGKLISGSGMVQTIAAYAVQAGFTGKLFAAATFVISCLLAFSTGTSVGTYMVVIPILFPVGVMTGVAPVYMLGAIVSGAGGGSGPSGAHPSQVLHPRGPRRSGVLPAVHQDRDQHRRSGGRSDHPQAPVSGDAGCARGHHRAVPDA